MPNAYGSNWPNLRRRCLERDEFKCLFCGATDGLVAHHIRPLSRDGGNVLWNLVTLCSSCHYSSHAEIDKHGLCTIPDETWEDYFYELTDHEDVIRYAYDLNRQGIDPAPMILRELGRPIK